MPNAESGVYVNLPGFNAVAKDAAYLHCSQSNP